MREQIYCLVLIIKQFPSQKSALKFYFQSIRCDWLACHQQEAPDSTPMFIWDADEDREWVEVSLRNWIWLSDSWTKLPFDFAYSRSHQLNWFSKDLQISLDNQSLEVLIVIYVDGNLVLNLPSTRNLEEVDSQLLIWVSSNLILQVRDESWSGKI